MERHDALHIKMKEAIAEYTKWRVALEREVKNDKTGKHKQV